jgi:hypothetical protein
MLTVSHTPLYILCYDRRHEGGGLIDGQAYSHLGDAEFALATHRRNHHEGFATDEELQSAADDVFYGLDWSGDRCDDTEVHRAVWVWEHTWVSDKDILIKDGDDVCLHIGEKWSISDYTCWVREIEVVPRSEQSKLRDTFVRTRENKVSSADVTRAYEPNT